MTTEPDDPALARLFAALREAEQRRPGAPGFVDSWERARQRAARPGRTRAWRLVAASALAIAAVLAILVLRRPASRASVDVASWSSPTAYLLRGPGDALLRAVPTLGTSVIPSTPLQVPGGTP